MAIFRPMFCRVSHNCNKLGKQGIGAHRTPNANKLLRYFAYRLLGSIPKPLKSPHQVTGLLDYPFTAIDCTLDGMAAVVQLFIEVEAMNTKAVGYQLPLALAREQCNVIKIKSSFGQERTSNAHL